MSIKPLKKILKKNYGLKLLATVTFLIIVFNSSVASAASVPLKGYAWSENIGWIALNCADFGDCDPSWKVEKLDNGYLSGYAWSDNIGWIKFGGLSGFPSLSGSGTVSDNAKVVVVEESTNAQGWIKACGGMVGSTPTSPNNTCTGGDRTDGWDGWISLSGNTSDGGTYKSTLAGNVLTGWAWGGDVVGWIQMGVNAVKGVTVTDGGCEPSSSVIVSWQTVSGATGYYIYTNGEKVNPSSPVSATTLSYTVSNLFPRSINAFQVSAVINGTETAPSGMVAFVAPPSCPTLTVQYQCDITNARVNWFLPSGVSASNVSTFNPKILYSDNNIFQSGTWGGVYYRHDFTGLSLNVPYKAYIEAVYDPVFARDPYNTSEGYKARRTTPFTIGNCVGFQEEEISCSFSPENNNQILSPLVGRPVTLKVDFEGGTPPYSVSWTDDELQIPFLKSGVGCVTWIDETTCKSSDTITRVYSTVGPKTITALITDSSSPSRTMTCEITGENRPFLKVKPIFREN